ncbi:MAG: DMT family transporter [Gemmatimonadota bacterium]|nr:DMT family transporter [Gemmatimonadota bacterium]
MTHGRAVAGLVLVTAVWGAAFTVIKAALVYTSPMVLLACRFSLAMLLMAFAVRGLSRRDVAAGALVGLLFFGGFVFQTNGLAYTTPSRSAFITALSVPFTPLIVLLAHRQLPSRALIGGVALALLGTWLLTDPGGGGLNRGDLLTVASAALFAGQIVAGGHFVRTVSPRRLLLVEITLTALLSLSAAPLVDRPMRLEPTLPLAAALAFLSVSAVGTFWYQLRAQQVVSPSETALVFSLEPVFAALVSWVVIGETLGVVQWLGGTLILGAMMVVVLTGRPPVEGASPR